MISELTRQLQGQISAQRILHLRNPNLGPNSGKRILDARNLDPNSRVGFFLILCFQQKRPPEKFILENSPPKIHLLKFNPEIGAKTLPLHLCRAIWLRQLRYRTITDFNCLQTQWARRDRLMSRGKNCREAIFVSHLSRNYPHRGGNFERG